MTRNSLGLIGFVLLLFSFATGAQAQGAFYGTVGASGWGIANNDGYSVRYKNTTPAITAGFFGNFESKSRLKAGIDLRGIYGFKYQGGGAGLVALRISFVPRVNRFQPFFELGAGIVSTVYDSGGGTFTTGILPPTTIVSQTRSTTGDFMLDFGLDVRVTRQWDWRVLEYGAAANGNNNGANVGFISTGLVYRVPERRSRR